MPIKQKCDEGELSSNGGVFFCFSLNAVALDKVQACSVQLGSPMCKKINSNWDEHREGVLGGRGEAICYLIRETKSASLVYTNKTKAEREHNCCL